MTRIAALFLLLVGGCISGGGGGGGGGGDDDSPGGWTCPDAYYGTNDGCDCGCGDHDPDCNGLSDCSAEDCCASGCDFTWPSGGSCGGPAP